MRFKLITSLFVILLIYACKKEDDCGDDTADLPPLPRPFFLIKYHDSFGNDLIGSRYDVGSFPLFNGNHSFLIKSPPHDSTSLQIFYKDIVSGSPYFLKLDETDQDTFIFNHEVFFSKCFDEYYNRIISVIANDDTLGNFIVKKE